MKLAETNHKQIEVGLIPKDWDVKPHSEIADIIDSLHQTPKFSVNGYPMVRVTDIKYGKLNLSNTNKVAKEVFEEFTRNYLPKKGDLVMSRVGSYGVVSYVNTSEKFCMGQNTVVINPRINGEYLYYILISPFTLRQIELESYGTGYKSLSLKNIRELQIPIPKPTEQKAIATVLSDTDALIQALEKKIAKKKQIKKGVMQELLRPKEGWVQKPIGEVGDIITGSTPSTSIEAYWNGDIPWITPTDINQEKDIFTSEREITQEGLYVTRKLPKDTLLVTCIASIGKNAILRKQGACNQQINAIVPNKFNDIDFLYYLIEKNSSLIKSKAGITATLMISKKAFSEIIFSFPPTLEEQTRIAQILSDMDKEIEALQQKLAKYQLAKQGMMQQLLTGKIRLV